MRKANYGKSSLVWVAHEIRPLREMDSPDLKSFPFAGV